MAKKKADASLPVIDIKPNPETKTQSLLLQAEASKIVVTNAEECRLAGEFLVRVQRVRRWADGVYKNAKKPLNKALKELNTAQKADIDPLVAIEKTMTRVIQDFRRAEEERKAAAVLEEQRRREADAQQELKARADELRAAAEGAPKSVARQLLKQAEVIETSTAVVDPVDIAEEEDDLLPDNMHNRDTYHAAVDSKDRLVLQVAAQAMIKNYGASGAVKAWLEALFKPNAQASMELVTPQMAAVNKLARDLKTDLQLEGVRAVKDSSLVSRD